MKTRLLVFSVAMIAVMFCGVRRADARVNFSVGISIGHVNDFYEPLRPYGYWAEVGTYGRCWRPAYIGTQWQPYSNGHWEWTDQGWFWVSDEPWAWATYHYGRWAFDSYYGWVWVPDVQWGPSWVAWREGGGCIGWAPLPPHCEYGPGGVLLVERIRWHPRSFVFVDQRHFREPIRPTVIVRNQTIINQTVYINNIQRGEQDHGARHGGPSVERVQEFSSQRIEQVAAADLWRERSDRVTSRATQEHVTAPPTHGPSSVAGRVETPTGISRRTGEETRQPSSPVERDRRTVVTPTPAPTHPSSQPSVQRAPESRGPSNENRGRFFGGQVPPPVRTPTPSVTREEVAPRSGRTESPAGRVFESRGDGRRTDQPSSGNQDDSRRSQGSGGRNR